MDADLHAPDSMMIRYAGDFRMALLGSHISRRLTLGTLPPPEDRSS